MFIFVYVYVNVTMHTHIYIYTHIYTYICICILVLDRHGRQEVNVGWNELGAEPPSSMHLRMPETRGMASTGSGDPPH